MKRLSRDSSKAGQAWHALLLRVAPKLLLLAGFLQLSNDGVLRHHRLLVQRGETVGAEYFVVIWGATLIALCLVAFLPAWRWRLFWAVVICASALLGKSFRNIMGADLTPVDIDLLWQARGNLGDAVQFYSESMAQAAIAAGLGLAAFLWPPPRWVPWLRVLLRRMVWLPVIPAIVVVVMLHDHKAFVFGLPQQVTPAVIGGLYMAQNITRGAQAQGEQGVSLRHGPGRARHIVVLLDESIRGDFIDLNRDQNTTPFLLSQAERIVNFGMAAASYNCSAFSNAILRFAARREALPDGLFAGPSLWQYARKAGYRTVFVDAQLTGGEWQNHMHAGEVAWIDEFVQFDGVAKHQRDLVLAGRLQALLARPEPSFIYVNKAGVHFPYRNTYPPGEAAFLPDRGSVVAALGKRELLLNAYKNGVRWAVDVFFRRLFDGLDLSDSLIIYSSDHGQHLMEDGFSGTHCRSQSPHPSEGLVPMMVLTDSPSLRRDFDAAALINRNKTSHFNVVPTILKMMGYREAAVHTRHGPSLLEPLNGPLRFAVGGMLPGSGSKLVWLDIPAANLAVPARPVRRAQQAAF